MDEKIYTSFDELPLFLTAQELQVLLGLSRSSVYELMHSHDFPSVRIGNRFVVSKDEFMKWIQRSEKKKNK